MVEKKEKENFVEVKTVSKFLECFSSPVRLMIICSLIDGEKNVKSFSSNIKTTKGNVSQHLKILETNGILQSRKEGNKVFYSIKNKKVIKFVKKIKKLCCNMKKGES